LLKPSANKIGKEKQENASISTNLLIPINLRLLLSNFEEKILMLYTGLFLKMLMLVASQ